MRLELSSYTCTLLFSPLAQRCPSYPWQVQVNTAVEAYTAGNQWEREGQVVGTKSKLSQE